MLLVSVFSVKQEKLKSDFSRRVILKRRKMGGINRKAGEADPEQKEELVW